MNSNLDPIRILLHKSHDLSLETEAVGTLLNAALHLSEQDVQEEKIALWIEGRL